MATFTAGTSFTDGVTGDVTASKLNALVANATPLANLITDRTAETSIATDDLVMISDTSESGAINKMTVANLMKAELTGTINSTAGTIQTLTSSTATITDGTFSGSINSTAGTIGTLNSTTGTITTGVIPALTSTTLITSGTGTAAAPAIVPTGDTNTGIFFPAADTAAISTAGSERVRVDSSGNVGIGISDPSNYNANGNNLVVGNTTDANGITITSGTASSGGLFFADEKVTGFSGYLQYDHSSDYIRIATNATERLRITSGGEVYIAGTTDQGAYNLQVNGTGVWGAGAYVNGSDERLKENIQDITSGLDVVEKLRPVSFQYKEEYTADRSVQSGFIAQDLLVALEGKNYLDGIVSQGPTYYNVAYQNLIPILAKAIQELKAENESLKTRISALEAA